MSHRKIFWKLFFFSGICELTPYLIEDLEMLLLPQILPSFCLVLKYEAAMSSSSMSSWTSSRRLCFTDHLEVEKLVQWNHIYDEINLLIRHYAHWALFTLAKDEWLFVNVSTFQDYLKTRHSSSEVAGEIGWWCNILSDLSVLISQEDIYANPTILCLSPWVKYS